MYQIWERNDKVLFFFDDNIMMVYPDERAGFDKVFARFTITNKLDRDQVPHEGVVTRAGPGSSAVFFDNYLVRSQKENNVVVIMPLELNSFLEDLKVLIELGYNGEFKLSQSKEEDGTVKKYLSITGKSPDGKDSIKSYVEIEAIFSREMYPQEIEPKQVKFSFEASLTAQILQKFSQRFVVLGDREARLSFRSS